MTVTFIPGPYRLITVEIIKEELHISLKEAKDCVDAGQFECTEEQLKIIKPKLAEIGNDGFKVIH
jgi:ribosomal protein L7/L12